MADLEIVGSHEEQWGIVKSAVKQHHSDLYGNGQPGVMDFVSSTRGQFRLLIILISVVGVLVSVLALLEANRQLHSKFSLKTDPTVVASQNAEIPKVR